MKIIVYGASGQTGIRVVEQALENGYTVTAAVRSPEKIKLEHEQLNVVQVDVRDREIVADTVKGHDAVVCALGSSNLKDTVRSEGTANIVAGMEAHGVERIVIVSSLGVGDSGKQLSFSGKLFVNTVLKNVIFDHERQEKLLVDSALNWTSVRPSGLTEGARTGKYTASNDPTVKGGRIRRADVADFILKVLAEGLHSREAITIT